VTGALRTRLINFTYLQLLDLLTTVAFLLHGVQEGNPLVKFAMDRSPNPFLGLMAVKVAAMGLAAYCGIAGRERLLGRINFFFALVVAWNLVALIFSAAGR